jgi:deferrochelatase/peroxidase EfeB
VPTPGSGVPLKPGEFILGYPDEDGPPANLPRPETLSRNGSYMAYRRLQEHVGRFRDFLRQHGQTSEKQELLAAKLMGHLPAFTTVRGGAYFFLPGIKALRYLATLGQTAKKLE